jgi:hypothetical protein
MGLYAAIQDPADRRQFVGGSDARTIMGDDEAALLRLWREKRGEIEPEDLSGNLIVQLGVVTEPLNRHWFERNSGQVLTAVQSRVQHPVVRWMAATLDGMVEASGAVFEAKFMLPWSFSEEGAAEKYMPQLQHNRWVVAARSAVLSVITGGDTIHSWAPKGHWVLISTHLPVPFSSMNSMPASSSARRRGKSFATVMEVASSVSSAQRIHPAFSRSSVNYNTRQRSDFAAVTPPAFSTSWTGALGAHLSLSWFCGGLPSWGMPRSRPHFCEALARDAETDARPRVIKKFNS